MPIAFPYSPIFILCHIVPLTHFYMQLNRRHEAVTIGTISVSSTIDANEGQRLARIAQDHFPMSHTKIGTAP